MRVSDRIAFLVPRGLGEYASQLGFPRMRRLTFHLALPAHCLFLHHGYTRSIHLHIQDGDRFAHHHRQIQLHGPLDLLLLALRNVGSDHFRCTLHCLGGHLQAGQGLHLLAAVIERCIRSHHPQHATHAGRDLGVLHIPFHIGGKLSLVAMRAQVVGAGYSHLAHHGEYGLGA